MTHATWYMLYILNLLYERLHMTNLTTLKRYVTTSFTRNIPYMMLGSLLGLALSFLLGLI